MRSFDLNEDMAFEVCGEKFTMKTVRPEVLALWEDEETPESAVKALELVDQRILAFLDNGNGQHDRWKELREREDNPVTIGQMNTILTWLMEEQTGRPTEQPSPSAPGRGRTAASSKAAGA